MRDTTLFEKIIPSIINVALVLILSTPLFLYFGYSLEYKSAVVGIFYVLQILDTHEVASFQCFGMRVFGTVWEKKYSWFQRNVYSILYTLSFSTLFFHIYVPFDLFLINMIALQLPAIILYKTTFHGLVAGHMKTQKLTS